MRPKALGHQGCLLSGGEAGANRILILRTCYARSSRQQTAPSAARIQPPGCMHVTGLATWSKMLHTVAEVEAVKGR